MSANKEEADTIKKCKKVEDVIIKISKSLMDPLEGELGECETVNKSLEYTIYPTLPNEIDVKLVIWLCGEVTDKQNEKDMQVFFHELLRLVTDNNVTLNTKLRVKGNKHNFIEDKVRDFNRLETTFAEKDSKTIKFIESDTKKQGDSKKDLCAGAVRFDCVIVMNGDNGCQRFIDENLGKSVPVIFIEHPGGHNNTLQAKYLPEKGTKIPDVKSELVHSISPALKSRHIAKAILEAIAKAFNKNVKKANNNEDEVDTTVNNQDKNLYNFICLCLSMDLFHIAVKTKLFSKAFASKKSSRETFQKDLTFLLVKIWKLGKPEWNVNDYNSTNLFEFLREDADNKLREILNMKKDQPELKGERCMETFFVVSLLANQIKSAEALWCFVENPLTAALVARGILKSGFVKADESQLKEGMKFFERLASEFVGRCYNRDKDRTFSLLRVSSPVWGSTDSIKLALRTENRKFLSRPALIDYNRRLWFFGTTKLEENELEMINNDSIIIWLRVIFTFLLFRIRTKDGWSFTNFFTPMCQFTVDTIGLLFNLIIYAGILMYQLKAADIHWTEYLFCAYIIPLLFEEIRQMSVDRMNYFKSVKNWLDITAVLLFLLAFSLRLAAYVDPQNTDLMGWTRIFYSLDFIAFAFLMFEKCYASDFLGPLLATISEMTVTLFKFLLILGVVFAAFAVASESVMYPNYDLEIQHIYSMSQRAFYNLFGEFSLETFQRNDCTNDPDLYNSNTKDRCVTAHAVYFVPILLAFFVFIVNILLFNLLIASFNSKITQIELKSMEIWHTQLCQLTIEYTGRHVLPIPFLIYSFHQMCSCSCPCSGDMSKSKVDKEFEEQEMLKFKRELDFEKRLSKLRKRACRIGIYPDASGNGVTQNFYFMNGLEADAQNDDNNGFLNMLESWDFHEAEETEGDSGSDSSITTVSGSDESEDTESSVSMFPDQQLSIQPREDITSSLASHVVRSLRAELKESDILAVCHEIRSILRRRGNLSGAAHLHRPGAQNITIPQEFARTVADQVTKQLRSLIHELMDRNEDAPLSPYVKIDSRFDREAATVILRNSTRRASGVGTTPVKGAKAKNEFYVVRRRSRYGLNWQWYDVGAGAGEPKKPNGKRDADEPDKPTGS